MSGNVKQVDFERYLADPDTLGFQPRNREPTGDEILHSIDVVNRAARRSSVQIRERLRRRACA